MLYERNDFELQRGTFRAKGDTIELIPAYERKNGILIEFFGDEIEKICEFDTVTGAILKNKKSISIFPASHFVTGDDDWKKYDGENPSIGYEEAVMVSSEKN